MDASTSKSCHHPSNSFNSTHLLLFQSYYWKILITNRQNKTPRISLPENKCHICIFYNSTTFHLIKNVSLSYDTSKKEKVLLIKTQDSSDCQMHPDFKAVDMLKICLLELRKFSICLHKYLTVTITEYMTLFIFLFPTQTVNHKQFLDFYICLIIAILITVQFSIKLLYCNLLNHFAIVVHLGCF